MLSQERICEVIQACKEMIKSPCISEIGKRQARNKAEEMYKLKY